MPPSRCSSSSPNGFVTLKFQNKLCHCGRKAALSNPDSDSNSRSFYYCEKHDCGYFEYYVPVKDETSASKEIFSHGNSISLDNKKNENDEFEEMTRKCGSLMQHLHVLQGTVSGLKLSTITIVMVCFLSLIMNFVLLMYK